MRSILLAVAGLILTASAPLCAADAVNTVCPIKGKAVDGSKTVEVTTGKGAKKQKVLIAVCCNGCAGKVEADPEAALATATKK